MGFLKTEMLRDVSRQPGVTKNKLWGGKGDWQGNTEAESLATTVPEDREKGQALACEVKVFVSCSAVGLTLCDPKFLCLWNSPGKNTGVGCHSLLQGIFSTQGSNPGLLHCRKILYHLSYPANLPTLVLMSEQPSPLSLRQGFWDPSVTHMFELKLQKGILGKGTR